MISAELSAEADRVRNAWGAFLGRWVWDWFVTLTFKESPYPEEADKLFRVLVSKLNRKLYGVRWAKHGKGVRWARATELQRRGAIHNNNRGSPASGSAHRHEAAASDCHCRYAIVEQDTTSFPDRAASP